MKHRASRNLVIALGLAAALAMAAARSIVHARGPGAAAQRTTNSPASATGSGRGLHFVHVTTASNTSDEYTWLYHPFMFPYHDDAILFVTPNIGPYGGADIYNPHPVTVWWALDVQWALYNQDLASMPLGVGFNMLMTTSDELTFVHEATSANMFSGSTRIDHPLANGNPNAILLVTQSIGSGGGVPFNDHSIGVWYDDLSDRWAIFNEDTVNIPEGALFNVQIVTADPGAFVHRASAGNTDRHVTFIDHPLANDNPHAIPFVTQNRNPGGGWPGTLNDHEIAVLYAEGTGRWAIVNQDGANMPLGASFNVMIPNPDPEFFVHEATTANTVWHSTYFHHDLTDEDPYALLLATQNWNPGGGLPGIYNDHAIAMLYSGTQWGIRNQDLAQIAVGAAFNVLIPNVDAGVTLHRATDNNTSGTSTYIDHPATNGVTDALVFVTPNFSPGGVDTGVYNDHPIGVWYNSGEAKWAIFNEDYLENMPVGAAFNVLVRSSGETAFVHYATFWNIVDNWTTIDHPLANDNPNAILLVTQNYNPGGVGGTHNPHEIGVWYSPSSGRWAIFNQDMADMPEGAAFNVLIRPPFRVYLPLVIRSP